MVNSQLDSSEEIISEEISKMENINKKLFYGLMPKQDILFNSYLQVKELRKCI